MPNYKLTLSGQGGELDSTEVFVAPNDIYGVRLALCAWLQESVLDDGDTITITSGSDDAA